MSNHHLPQNSNPISMQSASTRRSCLKNGHRSQTKNSYPSSGSVPIEPSSVNRHGSARSRVSALPLGEFGGGPQTSTPGIQTPLSDRYDAPLSGSYAAHRQRYPSRRRRESFESTIEEGKEHMVNSNDSPESEANIATEMSPLISIPPLSPSQKEIRPEKRGKSYNR